MEIFRSEAIILQTVKFKDYDQILNLFSREEGLLNLYVKNAFRSQNGRGTLTVPLSQAEFVYSKGKSDLFLCREISMIHQHLALRQTMDCLEAACELLQIIQKSLMPHAPAPHLYQLLVSYLQNLPHCQFPHAAVASFQLKVLRHEGLISLLPICSICRTDLHHQFLAQGESFCSLHAPAFALELCPEETLLLQNLAFCKTFSQIAKISLSDAFKRKIKTLFWDRLHQ